MDTELLERGNASNSLKILTITKGKYLYKNSNKTVKVMC
jgi:hypothetical protein